MMNIQHIFLRFIGLFGIFLLIDSFDSRSTVRTSTDLLFKQFVNNESIRRRRTTFEYRPVEGPINIEQLPAMLASRFVQRYPFSQKDDPAEIGR